MDPSDRVQALLPLTPLSLHILVALAPGGLHGYGIIQRVREAPTGGMNPGTGTFYSALHRMREEGLVVETEPEPDGDSRRRTYAITDLGRAVLDAETRRLEQLISVARAATANR